MHAAGCCFVGPGHEVAGCGIHGGPGASAGSLVARVRVPKPLGLLPNYWHGLVLDYWQAELFPGVWLLGPGIPELISDHW